MSSSILDSLPKIKKLDSQNMLGSLRLLSAQVAQINSQARTLPLLKNYRDIQNIVVLGMGGSALGAHVIKSVFHNKLKAPLEIINGYHLPAFVNRQTLVVVSSYSGTTEEPLYAMREARQRTGKLLVITSGGKLASEARRLKIPALIFSTENNPCGSPRMGLGYSIVGQMILLSKTGLIAVGPTQISAIISAINRYGKEFGVGRASKNNMAKHLAAQALNRTVWYFGAEHLSGNVHIGANQMNENAKRFAGYFLIPELNHHLMEGLPQPLSNRQNLFFILVESGLYDWRVQKRFAVTKTVLAKNKIPYASYRCREKNAVGQAMELLVLTSYASYYSALLEGIDPTAIPLVDYFKAALEN